MIQAPLIAEYTSILRQYIDNGELKCEVVDGGCEYLEEVLRVNDVTEELILEKPFQLRLVGTLSEWGPKVPRNCLLKTKQLHARKF